MLKAIMRCRHIHMQMNITWPEEDIIIITWCLALYNDITWSYLDVTYMDTITKCNNISWPDDGRILYHWIISHVHNTLFIPQEEYHVIWFFMTSLWRHTRISRAVINTTFNEHHFAFPVQIAHKLSIYMYSGHCCVFNVKI